MVERWNSSALAVTEVAMNKVWHAVNPMPPKAGREQRVRWHAARARVCACRPVPASLREDVERAARPKKTAQAEMTFMILGTASASAGL
jgi:hypothetical protein